MSTARVKERIILSMKKNPPQQLDSFCPKGLRVLLVDDNPVCLATMERKLQQCHYNVTICSRLSQANSLLTEKRVTFDIIMSEVCLQEEGGFKLLEIAGLGLDIPVILMSAKGETSVVMRGITHGACDYLIKPIRIEVLRNIWQHVVRRRQRQQYQHCNFNLNDSLEGQSSDGVRTIDSAECGSKKRNDRAQPQESDTGQRIEDISGLKKARVHWTVQLHQQFVNAVNQLQIDNAVPKKILDIMKVQGLTRENVASHLQKYRIYLRCLSGIIPEPCPVASFQAAGEGKAGGSMQIRQGGRHDRHQDHDDRLSPPSELKALNIGDPGAAVSSRRGGGGSGAIDRATLVSLQQYRAYEQRRAAANQAQSSSERGFAIEAGGCLSRKTRKKNCSAIDDTATPVETKGVIADATRWARLCATKSQSSFPTFTESTGITTVISQEAKRPEKTSSWNDAEDFFVDKFVHEYELPNLAAAEPPQDFMSTASATAPDISDYLIDDTLTQSK